jgi:glycosyltransferase involved in cell wall biosynthesis
MRIGIDCSCLAKPERTGVARYCSSFVQELPGLLDPEDRVVLLYRVSRLRRRRWFVRIEDPRFSVAFLNDRVLSFHPGGLDVVHGPDVRLPKIPHVPAVSTIHDLSALEIPGIAGERFRRRKAAALEDVSRRASVVLCVSQFTEATFLRRYPAAQGRTRVVPQGIGPQFRVIDPSRVRGVVQGQGIRAPYLLFVGQVSPRKNLRPLVEAFGRLHAEKPGLDLDLVIAGPLHSGADEVLAAAHALPVAGRVRFLGFVEDADLPAIYSGATAFCFPSKAEGFGMPTIEAMACGCPVVAARAGANATTAGDAALLYDPDDVAGLTAALRRILVRGPERADLIARGRRRAAQFSWGETAKRILESYREAFYARRGVGVPA